MADKHSLNCDVRELKLGASFTNNKTSQYHTIKYDFKPASVDVNKMANVDVGTNNQVTVTVPHLDGAGIPQTVFKGNQRPYTKECVLIIDRVTGEVTLEKLSSNIQVKKTRQESVAKPRPLTPVTSDFTNTTQRSTSRTRVATNRRTHNPAPGPAGASGAPSNGQARFNGAGPAGAGGGGAAGAGKAPQSMMRSPPRIKTSPPQAAPWSGGGNSTLASLPMIGLDDALGSMPARPPPAPAPPAPAPAARPERPYVPDRGAPPPDRSHHVAPPPERPHQVVPPPDRSHHVAPPLDRSHQVVPPPDRSHQVAPPPPAPPAPTQQDDSSSSSSSDSGSDSDSDSDDNDNDTAAQPHRALTNGTSSNPALPSDVLNDDLCLSESGSDSD